MLATSTYLIVFRIVHILAAIAWGGSVFLFVLFVQPSAKAIGPAAGPFVRELVGRRRLTAVILWLAFATIVAGGFLYWHDLQLFGDLGEFLGTSFGLSLTIGSLAAIAAFLIGLFGTRPNAKRMLELGARMAQAGDAPPPDLVRDLQQTQARLARFARLSLSLIVLAALTMATARYW